ncbi:hypothetical protein TELCIR_09343 [Teladorsagia circumcincta]|uniref:Aromatic-L-amino-acid decarboxylase n=1 Tax=Teladorsagia circumcincta TaxID=45464 RepID=A0A2G9UF54_TELCI|nr:hypothetical protein TELCIR_09343 [Teladorsagia circumcincta]
MQISKPDLIPGSFLACREFRYMSEGVEYADSLSFSTHKAVMSNCDCAPLWFRDGVAASKYFNMDAEYLIPEQKRTTRDNSHLQVGMGRRFRALKIYFVLRHLGAKYIKQALREKVRLAALFAELVTNDDDFELFVPQHLGLVCFRIRNGTHEEHAALCKAIEEDRQVYILPAKVRI